METIRVLLVDDHQVVREGLRRMIDLENDMRVVGEASNMDEAILQAEALSPDVILMGIKMPGADGVEATRKLKEKKPDSQIIMLTLYEDYITEAIEAGAAGYLLKDVKREELTSAIRIIKQGRAPLSPISRELFTEFVTSVKSGERAHFPERELEILRLIANGATSKEIGAQLFLSEATIKRHVQRIFGKLDVRNRSEAVAEAYRRKLI